jgi:hypothetical protein
VETAGASKALWMNGFGRPWTFLENALEGFSPSLYQLSYLSNLPKPDVP